MLFITSPSSQSPSRHWQNMHGMSNTAWAAFPNPLCQNCSNNLLITPNACLVGLCHFIRRQTCREVQRIYSSLNYLYQSRFLSAVSFIWNSEIQEKSLFFQWRYWQLSPTLLGAAQGGQPGEEGTQQQGEFPAGSSLPCLAFSAHAGHPAVGELNLYDQEKKNEM